jgi:hypothetical protein
MICSVIVVAVGLLFTLAGLFLTLKHDPPVLDFWEESVKHSLMSTAEIRNVAETVVRKENIKIELSNPGVRLLVADTALQLIGTAWQAVRLTCGG